MGLRLGAAMRVSRHGKLLNRHRELIRLPGDDKENCLHILHKKTLRRLHAEMSSSRGRKVVSGARHFLARISKDRLTDK